MPQAPPLEPAQFDRYRRHLSLPEFGVEGQRALLDSRVLLIGAGGLGCPLAQYLAAAGVGTLGIVDFDVVDLSNLQRQVLYGTADVGRPKVEVARQRVEAMNPDVAVEAHAVQLGSNNAMELLGAYDVVVDGTDNFPTRYLTNDACVLLGKPNVHGSIFRFEGQATVFDARHGPCYRCLYPEPPPPGAVPSCAEGGVLGVLPGIIALIQATETVKLLAGVGEPLYGRLLRYDALRMEFQAAAWPPPEVSAAEVSAAQARGDEFLLLDVREPGEYETAHIAGARLLPLGQLEARLGELESWRERRVVIHCHKGGRSARACELLHRRGFSDVANLAGGIDAWSLTVDPQVPRY
jgi:adenylyltransferase/sulfurtransferase